MPKIIVLYSGADDSAVRFADVAAEGAKGVRFAEVDVRAAGEMKTTLETGPVRHGKRLESLERIVDYDGVIFAAGDDVDVPGLGALFDEVMRAQPADVFADKVFAVVGAENGGLTASVGKLGGIVVSEPRGVADSMAKARVIGARVAKVSEWVRHALGHERARLAGSH